jgi:hypothetical protein
MFLVIDPDVFASARSHVNCQSVLLSIVGQLRAHQFAVDNDVIKREYLALSKANRDSDHPSTVILRQILDDSSELRVETSSDVNEFAGSLAALHITEPVEPHLLAMIARTEANAPVLLLPGATIAPRSRQLHDAAVCRTIRKRWCDWLDVRYASQVEPLFPPPVRVNHAYLDSDRFELLVGYKLQEADSPLHCSQPPARREFGEQIDVYGTKTVDGMWVIVVGECKLREEGNESRPIDAEAIEQVDRKARKVEAHFRRRRKVDNFRVERYIITNATDVESNTKTEANILINAGHPVTFWHAQLEKGWSRKKDWLIESLTRMEV